MKLISMNRSGFPAAALLSEAEDRVLPVTSAKAGHAANLPVSMRDLLEDWVYWRERLTLLRDGSKGWVPASDVDLLAPLPDPTTLTCIGLNYRDHALETGAPIPNEPVVFAKHPASVVGSGSTIVLPAQSSEIDFEVELAVVIGAQAIDVDPSEALGVVAGYTVMNDVSARDLQSRTGQWMPAKSFPTFGPMGPAFVTADEFGDGSGRRITLSVNGEIMQDSSTDEMIFTVADIISYLSHIWPLAPGDVIATGTPAGVGFTRNPRVFLRDGDMVEASIEGIGVLRNCVKNGGSRRGASR